MNPSTLKTLFITPFFNAGKTYLELLKYIIPILILVKIFIYFGGLVILDTLLAPVLGTLNLPVEAALIFGTTLLTGVHGGLILYLSLSQEVSFTASQIGVLAVMMLFIHNLPIELAISKRLGGSVIFLFTMRLIVAYIAGFLLYQLHTYFGLQQLPAESLLAVDFIPNEQTFIEEVVSHIFYLLSIFAVIYALLVFRECATKIMQKTGLYSKVDALFAKIGLEKHMAEVTVTGLLLGIVYGGSLLIQCMKEQTFTKTQIFLVITFLSLIHSIIEDTLLVMLMGAHILDVLLYKNLFGLLVFYGIFAVVKRRKTSEEAPETA